VCHRQPAPVFKRVPNSPQSFLQAGTIPRAWRRAGDDNRQVTPQTITRNAWCLSVPVCSESLGRSCLIMHYSSPNLRFGLRVSILEPDLRFLAVGAG